MIKKFIIFLFSIFLNLILPINALAQTPPTVSTSFSPVTASSTTSFTVEVKLSAGQDMVAQVFTINTGFDTSKLALTAINYLSGWNRSTNLVGDSTANVADINTRNSPQIRLIGEVLDPVGFPLTANQPVSVASLTFNVIAPGATTVNTANTSSIMWVKPSLDVQSLPLVVSSLPVNQTGVPLPPTDICPTEYSATQVKFKRGGDSVWSSGAPNNTITTTQTVSVAGFHVRNGVPSNSPEVDVDMLVAGNGFGTGLTKNSDSTFTFTPPTGLNPGTYTFTVLTTGKTGANCTGQSNLTVNAAVVSTEFYRIAENPADLGDTQKAPWLVYTPDITGSLTIDWTFADKNPGEKFIWVQFKDSNGIISKPVNSKIRLLGADPQITGCKLQFESDTVLFNITGNSFGSKGSVDTEVDGEASVLQVKKWTEKNIVAALSNFPVGQSFPIMLTNGSKQQSNAGSCSAVSQLSLGAKLYCGVPLTQALTDVDLTLVEATASGKKVKTKVNIDKNGVVQNLTANLEAGKKYKVSLKAANALRRVIDFEAAGGTTNIPNFKLPVGDIFPIDGSDGVINSLDKAELDREWTAAVDATNIRRGDFNLDGRVNSVDWSCMRNNFNQSDDTEPQAGLNINTISVPL